MSNLSFVYTTAQNVNVHCHVYILCIKSARQANFRQKQQINGTIDA